MACPPCQKPVRTLLTGTAAQIVGDRNIGVADSISGARLGGLAWGRMSGSGDAATTLTSVANVLAS